MLYDDVLYVCALQAFPDEFHMHALDIFLDGLRKLKVTAACITLVALFLNKNDTLSVCVTYISM
jgi:hypothetical protein